MAIAKHGTIPRPHAFSTGTVAARPRGALCLHPERGFAFRCRPGGMRDDQQSLGALHSPNLTPVGAAKLSTTNPNQI